MMRPMQQPNDALAIRQSARLAYVCIVLATELYLAFAARIALSGLALAHGRHPSVVELEALDEKHPGRDDPWKYLNLTRVLADGHSLRLDGTSHSSGWKLIALSWWPHPLSYQETGEPAVLTFQARQFVALADLFHWSGSIRIRRHGAAHLIHLNSRPGQKPQIISFEDPIAPSSAAMLAGAVILFGACAWWFGPLRRGRRSLPWLVFFLAVLHLLFWASQPIGTTNDTPGYLDEFQSVLVGAPAYFPPGYPFFVGMVGVFAGGGQGIAVTLLQHGMVVLSALWLYLLLRRIMPDSLALLGGILVGALTPAMTAAQSVISETPTGFAVVGALYYAVRSKQTRKMFPTVLAGLFTGWATILRVSPLVAVFPAICILCLYPLTKNDWRRLGITAAAMIAIIFVPLLWNKYNSGRPQLTASAGLHLFNRVVYEQKLLNEQGPATRRLMSLLQGKNPRDYTWWEVPSEKELASFDGRELLLRKVALEGVYKNPRHFLLYTPVLAWRTLIAPTGWIPLGAETPSADTRVENSPPLAVTASSISWRLALEETERKVWPILCWAAIAGTFFELLSRRRPLVLALAWMPAGLLLASACAEAFCPRYNAPIVPFVAVLALLPLDQIRTTFEKRSGRPRHSDLDVSSRGWGRDNAKLD